MRDARPALRVGARSRPSLVACAPRLASAPQIERRRQAQEHRALSRRVRAPRVRTTERDPPLREGPRPSPGEPTTHGEGVCSPLKSGELSYSAVREITRIATRRTERAWLAECRGKTVKEITELLAEREPGDRPESPRKPDLRMKKKTLEYPPHVEAILRQCRAKLEGEIGERVAEHEVLEAMGLAFLRGDSGASKRAPAQISISMCPSCKVARQNGAGVEIRDLSGGVRARGVRCAVARQRRWRARACGAGRDARDAEFVFARDKHRCRVPGCRSARNIELHHIVHREDGGSHEPSNSCACASDTMSRIITAHSLFVAPPTRSR